MKRECESFSAGIDAIDTGESGGWWEGLPKATAEREQPHKRK